MPVQKSIFLNESRGGSNVNLTKETDENPNCYSLNCVFSTTQLVYRKIFTDLSPVSPSPKDYWVVLISMQRR